MPGGPRVQLEGGVAVKLSVIVPVYNVEKYLADCVDSLLNQTIKDLEIFLVDDGSTDRSGEIADCYAGDFPDRVRTLHLNNGGQGRARNAALPMARGDYIGFVDSDDTLAPDMYEKLCAKAEKEGASIAVCDWLEVFPDGREEVLPARYQQHWLSASGSACNKVFRSELVGDTRFPEGRLWYEDFYFSAMLLIKAGGAVYVNEPLYIYRQSPSSTMRNNNALKNLDILRVLDMLEGPMLERGLRDDFQYFVLNHVLLDGINRVARQDSPDRKAVLKKLRAYAAEKIPRLEDCRAWREETSNRRLIMKLNYLGLYPVSRLILGAKAALGR